MSLIINMLKDLEKRQNPNQPTPPTSHYDDRNHQNNTRLIKLLIIFVVIITIALAITDFSVKNSIPATKVNNQRSTQPIAADSKPNKTVKPLVKLTSINDIAIKQQDKITILTLSLDHPAIYQLDKNKDKNTITLGFNNTAINSSILPTDIKDEKINSINIGHNGRLTTLTITFSENTQLDSISTSENNQKISLSLSKEVKSVDKNLAPNNPAPLVSEEAPATSKRSELKKPTYDTQLTEKYKDAIALAGIGKQNQAISNLSKLIKLHPSFQKARVALAAMLLEQNKKSRAELLINEGLKIDPSNLSLVELKAQILTSEGKIKQALALLKNQQPQIIENPNYHAFIAALFNQEKNYEVAANIYNKLVRIDPHQGSWWFGLGISQDKLGNNKAAVAAYTMAATEGKLDQQSLVFVQDRLSELQGDLYAKN